MNAIRIARWIPAAAIMGVSIVLSSMPTIEQMPQFWNADKLVHLICFGGLSFWVAFGANGAGRNRLWRWLIPVIITSAYGICDEIHQSFTPGRNCSVLDWVADTCGGALGSWAYMVVVDIWDKLRRKA